MHANGSQLIQGRNNDNPRLLAADRDMFIARSPGPLNPRYRRSLEEIGQELSTSDIFIDHQTIPRKVGPCARSQLRRSIGIGTGEQGRGERFAGKITPLPAVHAIAENGRRRIDARRDTRARCALIENRHSGQEESLQLRILFMVLTDYRVTVLITRHCCKRV